MVDEYRDYERHELNLIFHNVPESWADESSSTVADDIKSVLEITKETGVNQVKIVNAVRLGQRKYNNSRGRLLHVHVSNLNVKRNILFNAKKLRNMKHGPFKSVYIESNLSIKEMFKKSYKKSLKRERMVVRSTKNFSIAKNISETPMTVEHAPSQHEPENSDQSG